MKRVVRTLIALLVLALALPAIAQVTDEDIDRARREVNEMLAESQELGEEVQAAWSRQFALEKEITDITASVELSQVKIAETEKKLEEVAVEMYMGTSTASSVRLLFSSSDQSYGAGVEYLRNVTGTDVDVINQLRSYRTELDRQTERLSEASEEQVLLAVELEEKAGELQGRLIEAQAVYDRLVAQRAAEEEARRRAEEEARRQAAEEAARNATTTTLAASVTTAPGNSDPTTTIPEDTATTVPEETATTTPPPPASSGGACPVAGAVSFTDSWGDPRSGGRSHKGVDMIAARNTPLVAIFAGRIQRLTSGALSGLALYLRTENGDQFFYAHLESYADISVGQTVAEGEVIGYNGSSGNAPDLLPHLHFEYHPGGGSAANPYPLVRSLCG
ncbi:MAG TPA: peptidoglycan DD-metalloendopeptidase family protein [Acidimicrobiia bacterium]|nr:peptidoglycan DD-metalloendopeptidase family protein [Acidimicrobiia bacterium]